MGRPALLGGLQRRGSLPHLLARLKQNGRRCDFRRPSTDARNHSPLRSLTSRRRSSRKSDQRRPSPSHAPLRISERGVADGWRSLRFKIGGFDHDQQMASIRRVGSCALPADGRAGAVLGLRLRRSSAVPARHAFADFPQWSGISLRRGLTALDLNAPRRGQVL